MSKGPIPTLAPGTLLQFSPPPIQCVPYYKDYKTSPTGREMDKRITGFVPVSEIIAIEIGDDDPGVSKCHLRCGKPADWVMVETKYINVHFHIMPV